MKYTMKILLSLMIVFGFTNCATKPTHLELNVKADKDLNPNKNNIPSPMVLMMYELEEDELFKKLDYWSLHDEAKEKLEGKLISQSKQIITPDESQKYKIVFDKNAKYFGVLGGFRDQKGTWRFVKPLKVNSYNKIDLNISKNSIKEVE